MRNENVTNERMNFTVPQMNEETTAFVPNVSMPQDFTIPGKKEETEETVSQSVPSAEILTGEMQTTQVVAVNPDEGQKAVFNSKYIYLFVIALLLIVIAVLIVKMKKSKEKSESSDLFENTFEPDGSDDGTTLNNQCRLNIAKVHNIGKRPGQQDSFGLSDIDNEALVENKGVLTVVADGMGGLEGGDQVSSRVVIDMITEFTKNTDGLSPDEELKRLLNLAVTDVNNYLIKTIGLKKGGSTLISGIIKENKLYWISIGDSRISLFRNGRLVDLNQKHNWGAELDKKVLRGEITAQQAESDVHRAELTSYIGMGQIKYVDSSAEPLILQPNDKIIFMTDGIFNTLSDEEIEGLLSQSFDTISNSIGSAVAYKNVRHQDNYTAVILEYV